MPKSAVCCLLKSQTEESALDLWQAPRNSGTFSSRVASKKFGFKEAYTSTERRKSVLPTRFDYLLSICENEMYLRVELSQGAWKQSIVL